MSAEILGYIRARRQGMPSPADTRMHQNREFVLGKIQEVASQRLSVKDPSNALMQEATPVDITQVLRRQIENLETFLRASGEENAHLKTTLASLKENLTLEKKQKGEAQENLKSLSIFIQKAPPQISRDLQEITDIAAAACREISHPSHKPTSIDDHRRFLHK